MRRTAPDSPVADRSIPSPNHGERRGGRRPDMIVLHYTGMADAGEALQRLCAPGSEVSAHYLVFEDGGIAQLVAEQRRAWHAGLSSWAGETDINSASIGIEIANPGHDAGLPPFPPAQIERLLLLLGDIARRWSVPPRRVLAHSDVAPARKRDPGERFPWRRLGEAGLALWVPPAPLRAGPEVAPGDRGEVVEAIQSDLAHFGYGLRPCGLYDAATETVVTAFQRRFRPERIDGRADPSTRETLAAVMAALAARPA